MTVPALCIPDIITHHIGICLQLCLSMNEKGRQMRLSNGVELCPAVFQMVCHLKVLQSHLGQINFYQPRIYSFSIFVLFLLSDTTNSIKRRFSKEIENEADPYKRRLNQVQDVCRQYGLAMESDGESHKEEGIDYRRIHTEYIGKVPDKVTRIEFIISFHSGFL